MDSEAFLRLANQDCSCISSQRANTQKRKTMYMVDTLRHTDAN